MSKEERGALITAIHLRQQYAVAYLEGLSDRELVQLYDRCFSI